MTKELKVISEFEPAGAQPDAIKSLVEGLDDGLLHQTLLGVTGSGKTFTMAKVIEETQRPAIVMAHNKTLAAQLYGEFRDFFPNNSMRSASLSESAGYTSIVSPLTLKVALLKSKSFLVY